MSGTILLTGFSPFPGAPENPTAWLVEQMQGRADVVTHVLPATFDTFERNLLPLIARYEPAAIVSFGLSAKATGFTLERTARNIVLAGRPDFAGNISNDDVLERGGPDAVASALPLGAIAGDLSVAGLPWDWSDSAGDYICNLIFYRMLRALAHAGRAMPAGFIHVPYLTSQAERLVEAGAIAPPQATLGDDQLIAGTDIVLDCVRASLARRAAA